MFKPEPEIEIKEIKPQARKKTPLFSVVGFSGSGKTTLVEKLIAEMTNRGLKIGSIKHDAHGFSMDKPGKDSWRHKKAGASATIISSPFQIGMVKDVDHDHSPDELAAMLDFADIIIAEGFKRGSHPKIEVFRPGVCENAEPICIADPNLLAIASDASIFADVPVFSLNDISGMADFILARLGITAA